MSDDLWIPFGKNVGERRKSHWLKGLMDAVNRRPQRSKEFHALAEARGHTLGDALDRAMDLYIEDR